MCSTAVDSRRLFIVWSKKLVRNVCVKAFWYTKVIKGHIRFKNNNWPLFSLYSFWLKVYRFIWMIENKILKNFFFGQNLLMEALFLPLVKAKNQFKIWKTPKTKKIRNQMYLNDPNFCYFSQKNQVNMVKNVKKC